jgi:hypothetical protein
MHLWLGAVVELKPRASGITDEELSESAPLMRALVVQRLELMWRGVEPFVDPGQGKPDPRFVEAGIRILDRLGRVFRLDDPVSGTASEVTGSSPSVALTVAEQVTQLELRQQ